MEVSNVTFVWFYRLITSFLVLFMPLEGLLQVGLCTCRGRIPGRYGTYGAWTLSFQWFSSRLRPPGEVLSVRLTPF